MNQRVWIIIGVLVLILWFLRDKVSESVSVAIDWGEDIVNSGLNYVVNMMATAIQEFEDYVVPGGYSRAGQYMANGSRSYRNNNPGNLRWFSGVPNWTGAIGLDDQNHVIFDSYEHGWNALCNILRNAFNGKSSVYSPGFTLNQFFSKYAEANSSQYAEYVAAALGVSPNSTLTQIAGSIGA